MRNTIFIACVLIVGYAMHARADNFTAYHGPGGADTQMQYNDSGALAGSANLTCAVVADHNWSTVTPDLSIGDADEGIISFGSAFIGQADETISGVVLDDVLFIVNPTDTVSNLSFVLQSATGVGRFMVPEEGDDLATWNPRSMVIGPAATAATLDEGIHCDDAASSLFTMIDCDTGGTGADLGVQDDGEFLGTIYIGEALDGIGAVDMDYGSADVTDHTFTTDATGDDEIVLPDDSIGDAEISWAEVSLADLDTGAVTTHGVSAWGNSADAFDTGTEVCAAIDLTCETTLQADGTNQACAFDQGAAGTYFHALCY